MIANQVQPTEDYVAAWPVDGESLLNELGTFWSTLGAKNRQLEAVLETTAWLELENFAVQKQIRGRSSITQGGDYAYKRRRTARMRILDTDTASVATTDEAVLFCQEIQFPGESVYEHGRDFVWSNGRILFRRKQPAGEHQVVLRDVQWRDGSFSRLWTELADISESESVAGDIIRSFIAAIQNNASLSTFRQLAATLLGCPISTQDDTVLKIQLSDSGPLVICEQNAYRGPAGSIALVAAGDEIVEGQDLFDAVRFWDASEDAPPDWLASLRIPQRYFSPIVSNSLEFSNSTETLTKTVVDGVTQVTFPITGLSSAVAEFFAFIRAQEATLGYTLGSFLSGKQAPAANEIPDEGNPLEIIWRLWLSHGFTMSYVTLQPTVDLMNRLTILRRVTPPWLSHLVMFEQPTPDVLDCILPQS